MISLWPFLVSKHKIKYTIENGDSDKRFGHKKHLSLWKWMKFRFLNFTSFKRILPERFCISSNIVNTTVARERIQTHFDCATFLIQNNFHILGRPSAQNISIRFPSMWWVRSKKRCVHVYVFISENICRTKCYVRMLYMHNGNLVSIYIRFRHIGKWRRMP